MDYVTSRFLNSIASVHPLTVGVSIALASGLIVLIGIAAVLSVLQRPRSARWPVAKELLATVIVAYLIAQLIGVIAFRERPFVRHEDMHPLIHISAALKSFPSDHATIAFAIIFPLLSLHRRRAVRILLIGAGIGVAIGRVLVGVHYMTDVIGGIVLAWFVYAGVRCATGCIRSRKTPHAASA